MKKALKYFSFALFLLIIAFFAISWLWPIKEEKVEFGVTFSTVMARQLGLDPREVFNAIIDDLSARKIRLPIYWQDVEPDKGKFVFDEYNYFFSKAEDRGVKIVPIIGRKLPRWPECHIPSWITWENPKSKIQSTDNGFENAMDKYIAGVINHYKSSPAVAAWQLENEHFHVFGAACAAGKIPAETIDRELALIRTLDPDRPILLTDAGEGGWWGTSLSRSPFLGVTMYYQVWNPWWGVFWSPLGPGSYTMKRKFFELLYPASKIIVAELQTEPFWGKLLPDYPLEEQKRLMSIDRIQEVVRRARRAGFAENYLWGAEWWYWLKEKQSDSSLWDEAKLLFKI